MSATSDTLSLLYLHAQSASMPPKHNPKQLLSSDVAIVSITMMVFMAIGLIGLLDCGVTKLPQALHWISSIHDLDRNGLLGLSTIGFILTIKKCVQIYRSIPKAIWTIKDRQLPKDFLTSPGTFGIVSYQDEDKIVTYFIRNRHNQLEWADASHLSNPMRHKLFIGLQQQGFKHSPLSTPLITLASEHLDIKKTPLEDFFRKDNFERIGCRTYHKDLEHLNPGSYSRHNFANMEEPHRYFIFIKSSSQDGTMTCRCSPLMTKEELEELELRIRQESFAKLHNQNFYPDSLLR